MLGNDIKDILENSKDIQKDLSNLIENFGKDLGLNVKVIYAKGENLPKESQDSHGSAYVNEISKETTIVIDTSKITNTKEFIGTTMEELSHILDKVAGRQDEKVAKDKTNDEKGLESLGRPINDYFQEEFASSNKEILLQPDGKDYSNIDLGEHVGDVLLVDDTAILMGSTIIVGGVILYQVMNSENSQNLTVSIANSLNNMSSNINETLEVGKRIFSKTSNQVELGDIIPTPDTKPEDFQRGKNEGESGYENTKDESWWEKDRAGDRGHGGSVWKRWPSKPNPKNKKRDKDRRTVDKEGEVKRR